MAITMAWNVGVKKLYESGLDRPVLYVRDASGEYPLGVPWEGLISVSEKPGGAEITDLFANNEKYAQLVAAETFDGSIEAYTYPPEFGVCDGIVEVDAGVVVAQQARSVFGLCYRTRVGSDVAGSDDGYKIHIIYGCLAQPSEVSRTTINDSPEAATFSWEFKTTPVNATGFRAVSKITLDSTTLLPADLAAIEAELYGDDVGPTIANLPLPDDLFALLTP